MPIEFSRKELAIALAACARIAEGRSVMVSGSAVWASGPDGEIVLHPSPLNDIALQNIVLHLPASLAAAIVSEATGDTVLLNAIVDEPYCTIRSGRARYKVNIVEPPFPVLFEPKELVPIATWTYEDFLSWVKPVVPFAATKGQLCSVLFEATGNELSIVATDAYGIAVTTLTSGLPPTAVQLPPAILDEIGRLSALESQKIEILACDSYAEFRLDDNHILRSVVSAQKMPPWRRLFQTEFDRSITCDRDELHNTLRRADVILTQDDLSNFFYLRATPPIAQLSGTSPEQAEAFEEFDCAGDEIGFRFQIKRLRDLIGVFPSGPLNVALAAKGNLLAVTSDSLPTFAAYLTTMKGSA